MGLAVAPSTTAITARHTGRGANPLPACASHDGSHTGALQTHGPASGTVSHEPLAGFKVKSWVLPSSLRMMGAVDEEQVQVVLLRLQQQGYRSPRGLLNRSLDRPVVGQSLADSSDFSVYHITSSTMGRDIIP